MSSLLFRVFAVLLLGVQFCSGKLVNERVTRQIDLRTNIAQSSIDVTIKNAGDASESVYDIYLPHDTAAHVADIVVSLSNGNEAVVQKSVTDKGVKYAATLQPALAAGASTKINIYLSLSHALVPFPAEIAQSEPQLVVYVDTLHFYSPYTTEKQTTEIKLASSKIESYTKANPVSVSKDTISYGPYSNIKPFTSETLRTHSVNHYPMLTFTRLEKEIEVSHWGHISFEEHVDLTHSGAKLKGGFSRLDFQRNPASSPSNFRLLTAHLPASAHSVYYRDIIGNISTSRFRVENPTDGSKPRSTLELLPRYVLFGGWKTKFYYGYVSPLAEFLGITRDGKYSLNVPFGTAILGAVVDQAVVRVILPEGASDIKVSGVQGLKITHSVRQTYLDTKGRPVVELTKSNIVGDNVATLVVEYTFPAAALYAEPLLLIGGFFALFLVFIFSGRFHLTIGHGGNKDKETAQELSNRLHSLSNRVHKLVDSPVGETKPLRDELAALKNEIVKHYPEFQTRASALVTSSENLLSAWKTEKEADKEGRTAARKKRTEATTEFNHKVRELDNELTSKL